MVTLNSRTLSLIPFLGIAILSLQIAGCSNRENQTTTANEVTFICLETHEIVVLPQTPTPAINPKTGRRTLVEARFCRKCQKWYPVSQSEGIGGQPAKCVCPVDGQALVVHRDSD